MTRLFTPAAAIRVRRSVNTDTPLPPEEPAGTNPPDGAIIDYTLANAPGGEVSLEIADHAGKVVRRFSSADKEDAPARRNTATFPSYWFRPAPRLTTEVGLNRFVWDLRYPRPRALDTSYGIAAVYGQSAPEQPEGALVVPGRYQVKLTVDGRSDTAPLTVKLDPRLTVAPAALARLLAFQMRIARALDESAQAAEEISRSNETAARKLQPAFVRLNRSLASLADVVAGADAAPTAQALQVFEEYRRELDARLLEWRAQR